jgi:hypothetical protein
MQTDRRTDSERTSQRGITVRSAVRIPENQHSQEQTPGSTPENLASPIAQPAELTPENMELLAKYVSTSALAAGRAQAPLSESCLSEIMCGSRVPQRVPLLVIVAVR